MTIIKRCKMALQLFTLLALMMSFEALPANYKPFNRDNIFTMTEKSQGEYTASFSVNALDDAVEQLWQHAQNYPLQFDSDEERAAAGRDIKKLRLMVPFIRQEILSKQEDEALYEHVKLQEARIAVMAYNFDETSAMHDADSLYESLIADSDDDDEIAYLQQQYGQFLAMSARDEQALTYLQAALDGGRKQALRGLGLLALMSDLNREQALAYWTEYLTYYPEDKEIQTLATSLKDPDTEITEKRL